MGASNISGASTADKKKTRHGRDFIIRNTSADVLKSLSPQARNLWMTLRRLADARTGALRLPNGTWISAERIDAETGIHRTTRLKYMAELIGRQLVLMKPVYQVRMVPDRLSKRVRKRSVRTGFEYWVAESPRKDWVSSKVEVEKLHKQRVSSTVGSSKVGFFNDSKNRLANSSQTTPGPGDGNEESIKADIERKAQKAAVEDASLRKATAAADDRIRTAFELLNEHDPFGGLAFQLEWVDVIQTYNEAMKYHTMPHFIERCIQQCLRKNIPVPPPFYREKRMAEQHLASIRATLAEGRKVEFPDLRARLYHKCPTVWPAEWAGS